jgi:prephenate dehydratase
MKIAYCGRVGSFSHEAAITMFPEAFRHGFDTFAKAITEVEENRADYAILPIENSSAGRVAEIHNILPKVNLFFNKEYILGISHNLYVVNDAIKLEDIKEIHSHEQALMQCSNFISKTNATQVSELNTAIAAEKLSISKRTDIGVIASNIAGNHYSLHLLAENIQNNSDNFTTFIAMSKEQNNNSDANLTSILFTIGNKAGGIYAALGCFARNGVNLLKIESYIPSISSNYAQFFLTFSGNFHNENVQKAMLELHTIANSIKNFGSYNGDAKRFNR